MLGAARAVSGVSTGPARRLKIHPLANMPCERGSLSLPLRYLAALLVVIGWYATVPFRAALKRVAGV